MASLEELELSQRVIDNEADIKSKFKEAKKNVKGGIFSLERKIQKKLVDLAKYDKKVLDLNKKLSKQKGDKRSKTLAEIDKYLPMIEDSKIDLSELYSNKEISEDSTGFWAKRKESPYKKYLRDLKKLQKYEYEIKRKETSLKRTNDPILANQLRLEIKSVATRRASEEMILLNKYGINKEVLADDFITESINDKKKAQKQDEKLKSNTGSSNASDKMNKTSNVAETSMVKVGKIFNISTEMPGNEDILKRLDSIEQNSESISKTLLKIQKDQVDEQDTSITRPINDKDGTSTGKVTKKGKGSGRDSDSDDMDEDDDDMYMDFDKDDKDCKKIKNKSKRRRCRKGKRKKRKGKGKGSKGKSRKGKFGKMAKAARAGSVGSATSKASKASKGMKSAGKGGALLKKLKNVSFLDKAGKAIKGVGRGVFKAGKTFTKGAAAMTGVGLAITGALVAADAYEVNAALDYIFGGRKLSSSTAGIITKAIVEAQYDFVDSTEYNVGVMVLKEIKDMKPDDILRAAEQVGDLEKIKELMLWRAEKFGEADMLIELGLLNKEDLTVLKQDKVVDGKVVTTTVTKGFSADTKEAVASLKTTQKGDDIYGALEDAGLIEESDSAFSDDEVKTKGAFAEVISTMTSSQLNELQKHVTTMSDIKSTDRNALLTKINDALKNRNEVNAAGASGVVSGIFDMFADKGGDGDDIAKQVEVNTKLLSQAIGKDISVKSKSYRDIDIGSDARTMSKSSDAPTSGNTNINVAQSRQTDTGKETKLNTSDYDVVEVNKYSK